MFFGLSRLQRLLSTSFICLLLLDLFVVAVWRLVLFRVLTSLLLVESNSSTATGHEEHDYQNENRSPDHTEKGAVQLSVQTSVVEVVSDHHRHSSTTGGTQDGKNHGEENVEDVDFLELLLDDGKQGVDHADTTENKRNNQSGKCKSREIVVGLLVVNKVVREDRDIGHVEVVDRRDWHSRPKRGADAFLGVGVPSRVADPPEGPSGDVVADAERGGVSLDPVEGVEREAVHPTREHTEEQEQGGSRKQKQREGVEGNAGQGHW